VSAHKPVCAVVGVGPGNGAAIARRFSLEGYQVALLARSAGVSGELAKELPHARAYACDVANEGSVETTFNAIGRDLGAVDTLVYNAGSGVWGSIEDVTAAAFEESWKVNTLGAFLASKQVIGPMKQAGHGNIVFIGATASRRGNKMTAAFAPAKAAQRSLAESMARLLWPAGVHVSIVIVDGVVDLPRTRQAMAGKPEEFFVKPAEVAETVFHLAKQGRSAWSFEVEARPFGEAW